MTDVSKSEYWFSTTWKCSAGHSCIFTLSVSWEPSIERTGMEPISLGPYTVRSLELGRRPSDHDDRQLLAALQTWLSTIDPSCPGAWSELYFSHEHILPSRLNCVCH